MPNSVLHFRKPQLKDMSCVAHQDKNEIAYSLRQIMRFIFVPQGPNLSQANLTFMKWIHEKFLSERIKSFQYLLFILPDSPKLLSSFSSNRLFCWIKVSCSLAEVVDAKAKERPPLLDRLNFFNNCLPLCQSPFRPDDSER